MATGGSPSFLAVEHAFAGGSGAFLQTLLRFPSAEPLVTFAERWLSDARPWAREQLLAFIDQPVWWPPQKPLVKRLFKGAEARGDTELMAAFAVAFDRLVRRKRSRRWRWDSLTRESVEFTELKSPRDGVRVEQSWYPVKSETWVGRVPFSYHTRYYLRRRAWRFMRYLRFRQPAQYVPAVAQMLVRYRDADLAAAENVLDSWSLMHACFGKHPGVHFMAHRVRLAEGNSVGSLTPAPMYGELWQAAEASPVLLQLMATAWSHFVCVWAVGLFRQHHLAAAQGLAARNIIPLVMHADEAVQELGAELLQRASDLNTLQLADWQRLLQSPSLAVLEMVAALAKRYIDPQSATLFEAMQLACAEPAPVARLGLSLLQARAFASEAEYRALSHLADAKSAVAAGELVSWALGLLGKPGVYDVDRVSRFFDSLKIEVRKAAIGWLTETSAGWNDAALWSRLTESPFEDIRLHLVLTLERRRALPGATDGALAGIWTSVLLGIHRGGRHKLTALRQIADAVRAKPDRMEMLLPVLAVAIRSVRAPEARAGLAAVVQAVANRPELEPKVRQALPELQLA